MTRRARLIANAEEALRELRQQRLLGSLRAWREEPGTDRALLFGHNESNPRLPEFCVLIERRGAGITNRKFRGVDQSDAAAQALAALAAERLAS